MPIALIIIGMVLLIAGIRDNVGKLGALVAHDFSGPGNFFYWMVSVIIVGAIGYIPGMRNPSRAFIALILVVMILSNKGFFAKLQSAVQTARAPAPSGQTAPQSAIANKPAPKPTPTTGAAPAQNPVSGLSGTVKTFAETAMTAADIAAFLGG